VAARRQDLVQLTALTDRSRFAGVSSTVERSKDDAD
jgi:hypothetical protein